MSTGNAQRPDLEPLQAWVALGPDAVASGTRASTGGEPSSSAHDRERKRLVVSAVVLRQHRHAAHNAVVDRWIGLKCPALAAALLQLGADCADSPCSVREADVAPLKHSLAAAPARAARPAFATSPVVARVKVVAEHDRAVRASSPRTGVVIELRRDGASAPTGTARRPSARSAAKLAAARRMPELSSRSANTTSKPTMLDLVLVEQLVEQQRQAVAAARASALLSARLFSSMSRMTMRGSRPFALRHRQRAGACRR